MLRTAIAFVLFAASPAFAAAPFAELGVVEIELTSDRDDASPFWDQTVVFEATAPNGKIQRGEAFWDGGRTWRARWRGYEQGAWTWTTKATDPANLGLNARGTATHNGPAPPPRLRASADGSHLETDAGQPFFWLADTAWNGALRADDRDWTTYLAERSKQRFTAVQFVTTQWRGGDKTIPRRAFAGAERITVNPDAFADLDAKIAAIVQHGMRPSPVMLWSLTATDPGQALPEADAIRLAHYEVARWGALSPAWLLGGDGKYLGNFTPRWKRVGQAVFGDCPEQLVTLHPSGLSWIADAFAGELWLDYIGYQSGHGDGGKDLKWLVTGPPAHAEKVGKPVINLEPNYEGHPAYQSGKLHTAANVRRAAYWSLPVSAPAGVTYGNNEIWCWNSETADAENHSNLKQIRPWRDGLQTEGIADMTRLRAFFESGPWPQLRPAPHQVREQPGDADPRRFIAVAQTPYRDWLVAYLPVGGRISLSENLGGTSEWFNPRTGERQSAAPFPDERATFAAPDDNDWILSIHAK